MSTAVVVMLLACLYFLSMVAYYTYRFFSAEGKEKKQSIFNRALSLLSMTFILMLSLLINDKGGLLSILHSYFGDISLGSIARAMFFIVVSLDLIYFFKFSRAEK